jgi:hypothetical protein
MFETGRLIDNFFDLHEYALIYWIFGATVALIVLFIVGRLVRNVVGMRVRQVDEFGMDFDSVADMLDKGLLTPEEAKRVKAVLARHFKKLYDRKLSDEPARSAEEELADEIAREGGELPAAPAAPDRSPKPATVATPTESSPAPSPPSTPQAEPDGESVELPLDIMDMYRAGMISDEELEALRRVYAHRAGRRD